MYSGVSGSFMGDRYQYPGDQGVWQVEETKTLLDQTQVPGITQEPALLRLDRSDDNEHQHRAGCASGFLAKAHHMKPWISLSAFAALAFVSSARDAGPMLHDHELPLLASPDFIKPLADSFSIAKGRWTPENGVLTVLDLPEEKHIPVLHHKVGLASATIEVEFRFDGPGSFLVGCDTDKHVGRVVVNADGLSIAEDSVKPSHTIAKLPLQVKPGEWHHLRVEWKGEEMAATLDGHELKAQHPFLGTAKARSWLAAGKVVEVRNLTIRGEKG